MAFLETMRIKEAYIVLPDLMTTANSVRLVFVNPTRPTTLGISTNISNPERIIEYRDARGTVVSSNRGSIIVNHAQASCSSTTTATIRGAPQIGQMNLESPGITLFFGVFTVVNSYSPLTHCTAFYNDEFVRQSGSVNIQRRSTPSTGRVGDYTWFARVTITRAPDIQMLV